MGMKSGMNECESNTKTIRASLLTFNTWLSCNFITSRSLSLDLVFVFIFELQQVVCKISAVPLCDHRLILKEQLTPRMGDYPVVGAGSYIAWYYSTECCSQQTIVMMLDSQYVDLGLGSSWSTMDMSCLWSLFVNLQSFQDYRWCLGTIFSFLPISISNKVCIAETNSTRYSESQGFWCRYTNFHWT